MVGLDLKPLLQGQTRTAKLKRVYNLFIIDPRGLQCETNLQKSWAGNLLMWSDLTMSPSFKVKRGQPNLKGFITCLLLILEVCNVKPTCRILWAGNLLMSDLTFGPSFKVKRWFTAFGELSFRWIQICIGSPMRRSSCLFLHYKCICLLNGWLCAIFIPFSGRSNVCSPGNSGLDVFKLNLHIQLLFLGNFYLSTTRLHSQNNEKWILA